MQKKTVYIVEIDALFSIVNEINHLLSINFNYIKFTEFLKIQQNNLISSETIFVVNQSDFKQNNKNKFINCISFKKESIKISKFLEIINLFFLKISFKNNSKINFQDYTLDINSKYLIQGIKKLKLTEKETNIILYFLSQKKSLNSSVLKREVWNYKDNLETHTVETHIYRLRKKIQSVFDDESFLKRDKNGYYI